MASKNQYIFSIFLLSAVSLNAQNYNDYTYLDQSQNFYKIHAIPQTWLGAVAICKSEDATLFYPEDQNEADAVINFWKSNYGFQAIFIGVSSLNPDNVYKTVDDGRPIEQVYHNWGPGEPNNAGGVEHCAEMRSNDGTLNDINCGVLLPFVCKKSLDAAWNSWNEECNMRDLDYKYSPTLGKCYKFHLQPTSWQDAYVTCNSEGSYLAVINSQAEANHLAQITADAPKDSIGGGYLRGHVNLGYLKVGEEWMTIRGQRLAASGYTGWAYGQPDNAGGHEVCGGMFYGGQLNDISCETQCFFICEHDIETSCT